MPVRRGDIADETTYQKRRLPSTPLRRHPAFSSFDGRHLFHPSVFWVLVNYCRRIGSRKGGFHHPRRLVRVSSVPFELYMRQSRSSDYCPFPLKFRNRRSIQAISMTSLFFPPHLRSYSQTCKARTASLTSPIRQVNRLLCPNIVSGVVNSKYGRMRLRKTAFHIRYQLLFSSPRQQISKS